MGNCCKSCEIYRKPGRNITILVVGLDNAGKTTMAKRLAGEPVDSVLKTLGFSLVVLRYHSYQISLYDLGGSPEIRGIWSKYFMDAHGIIFVVDSSDLTRLEESKKVFADLLSHENVSGKPILVLANKEDKENALDELEIVDQLDIERVVNRHCCLTRVETCSAAMLEKYKMDVGIKRGFRWLVEEIIANYPLLNERVQRDMAEFALRVQRDRDAWKARMETNADGDACGDVPAENGNPFCPIDQVIKNINGRLPSIKKVHNGVLINNYVRGMSPSGTSDCSIPDFTVKNESRDNIPDFTVKTASQLSSPKSAETCNRPYSKHKRKFARFNKTAPMPIDALMRDKSTNYSRRLREVSKHSNKSDFEVEQRPKNYLTRRPATAPSKFNLSTIKVNTAWDMSTTPCSKAITARCARESSKTVDVVSFF